MLGQIIGGALGFLGQKKANKANLQIAREQMAFQERMSNTAYTRATKDLENAGLNRILALGSPASSPAGQTAQMQSELGAGVDKAAAAVGMKLAQAQVEKTKAETKLTENKSDAIEPAGVVGDAVGSVLDRIIGGAQGANAKYQKGMSASRAGATNVLEFLDLGGIKSSSAYQARRERNAAEAAMKRAAGKVASHEKGSPGWKKAIAEYEAAKRRFRSYGGKPDKYRKPWLDVEVEGKYYE
jgi:hypothetical protein